MSTPIESVIAEQLQTLDAQHQAEVLDFVQFLIAKRERTAAASNWPVINPARDLAQYIGIATGLPEDGVAYQRHIRDTEWL